MGALLKGAALRWWDSQQVNLRPQFTPGSVIPTIKWDTFDNFLHALQVEFGNPHEREEAIRELQIKYQGPSEKIGPFVTAVRELQGKARFGIDRLWETLLDLVNKDVREYITRNHPKLQFEAPRSEEACFATILSAGKAVEYQQVREVFYAQNRKAKELLKTQSQKPSRSSDNTKESSSAVVLSG